MTKTNYYLLELREGYQLYYRIAPMFIVDDVDEVVAYYQEVFETQIQYILPETPPTEWVSLLIGDVELMFWQRIAAQREYPKLELTSQTAHNLILYIYTKDIEIIYKQIKDKVTILMPLKEQPYGALEFTIKDRYNHIITFAQMD